MPYSIETCTKILGPLRQNVFACLTCTPPPKTLGDPWAPAGVCYACSVQCHGEHELVEIFQKRNFTCDCGTTRLPSSSPCNIRTNNETNTKGGVHSEEPDANNSYNQNFKNQFCGCGCDYDPFQQKGTMFQCLGIGTEQSGGCGEDWYHPGCLVGMGPKWFEKMEPVKSNTTTGDSKGAALATISEDVETTTMPKQESGTAESTVVNEEDVPMPPGFPDEDDFESFICYKCVESNPWIKAYAGTSGFLAPVFLDGPVPRDRAVAEVASKKRKAEDDTEGQVEFKRTKSEDRVLAPIAASSTATDATRVEADKISSDPSACKLPNLAKAPEGKFSLFFKEDFRDKFCRCSACYKHLNEHPQLLEEEEVYEPPISEDGASQHGGSTHGSGSLLERGESALRNFDRVKAIEGAMAYNHLKEQLKPFFRQFAESGQAIGAEDIKAYFAKLRGDEEGMKQAEKAATDDASGNGDNRREQSGF